MREAVEVRGVEITELVDAIANVIDLYMQMNPEMSADEAVCALDYVRASLFRLASETPASKLN